VDKLEVLKPNQNSHPQPAAGKSPRRCPFHNGNLPVGTRTDGSGRAQKLLIAPLEAEIENYLQTHVGARDEHDHRLVVRNGYGARRRVQTGLGTLEGQSPRVDDQREKERFTSRVLPPYLRRPTSLESLIPILSLKGISTSAMPQALEPLLGPNPADLAAASIVRLIESWRNASGTI